MPALDKLREILDYNPDIGLFYWRITAGRAKAGNIAGSPHNMGYWHIRGRIQGEIFRFLAHRLAWAFHYGEWPAIGLDHINGNRRDNRITNLRLATDSQNTANGKRRITNKSGFKGVVERYGSFVAYHTYQGKQSYLGKYPTKEQAHAAYLAAARAKFGEFARGE